MRSVVVGSLYEGRWSRSFMAVTMAMRRRSKPGDHVPSMADVFQGYGRPPCRLVLACRPKRWPGQLVVRCILSVSRNRQAAMFRGAGGIVEP